METILRLELRAYKHKELYTKLKIPKSTFNRELKPHLKKLGPRIGHRWSIKQVEMIFNIFWRPYEIITV